MSPARHPETAQTQYLCFTDARKARKLGHFRVACLYVRSVSQRFVKRDLTKEISRANVMLAYIVTGREIVSAWQHVQLS